MSNLNSLRAKHKDIEATISRQEEMIYNLKEENLIFKSKLATLENLLVR